MSDFPNMEGETRLDLSLFHFEDGVPMTVYRKQHRW